MEHVMRLYPKYYDCILYGTKRIEIRLLDEKRKKIKIGDTIRFLKMPDMKESMIVKVIDLLKYDSIDKLLNDFDISLLADKLMTKDELKEVFNQIYTQEEQEQYGVLGIRIEL